MDYGWPLEMALIVSEAAITHVQSLRLHPLPPPQLLAAFSCPPSFLHALSQCAEILSLESPSPTHAKMVELPPPSPPDGSDSYLISVLLGLTELPLIPSPPACFPCVGGLGWSWWERGHGLAGAGHGSGHELDGRGAGPDAAPHRPAHRQYAASLAGTSLPASPSFLLPLPLPHPTLSTITSAGPSRSNPGRGGPLLLPVPAGLVREHLRPHHRLPPPELHQKGPSRQGRGGGESLGGCSK